MVDLIDIFTLEERGQIFEYHLQSLLLKDKPIKYSKYLAHLTPGFSGMYTTIEFKLF